MGPNVVLVFVWSGWWLGLVAFPVGGWVGSQPLPLPVPVFGGWLVWLVGGGWVWCWVTLFALAVGYNSSPGWYVGFCLLSVAIVFYPALYPVVYPTPCPVLVGTVSVSFRGLRAVLPHGTRGCCLPPFWNG